MTSLPCRKPYTFLADQRRKLTISLVAIAGLIFLPAIIPAANAQSFNVIHEFTGGADGASPEAGLSVDGSGNFYGTSQGGGVYGGGAVYKVMHGRSGWIVTPLYEFKGGMDGRSPWSRVIVGSGGRLFGTTPYGGDTGTFCGSNGCGVVYSLAPPATPCTMISCAWPETILHRFSGGADGGDPGFGDLTFDQAGNIYGTTQTGGTHGGGVVYKLTPSNGSWTETVLYNFSGGSDGWVPLAGVTFDSAGNLYGTNLFGGTYASGTVYELKPSGSNWTEVTLHSFNPPQDGAGSVAGVVPDSSGNLYGATEAEGPNGGGTIYEITPSNGSWSFQVLYALANPNGQGGPQANLFWSHGNLYGTNYGWVDGNDAGSAFELTPSHGSWNYVVLHHFTFGNDGSNPNSNLIQDSSGNLYGTSSLSGVAGGTIYQITP